MPPRFLYGGVRNPFWRPAEDLDLIDKACKHNDTLADDERERLIHLPELDDPLIGRALAYPLSLTAAERRQVLGWPAEEVVAANIAKVCDGVMIFDDFVERAATDLGFLNFDRAWLILHDYHAPSSSSRSIEKTTSTEGCAAQQLLWTTEQMQAWKNAVLAKLGRSVEERERKLDRGILSEEEANEERQMQAAAKIEFAKRVWEKEVKQEGFVNLTRPQSDMDLYMAYYGRKRDDWLRKICQDGRQYGYAIYRTSEVRQRHPAAEARFKNETKYLEGDSLLFQMLKKQSPSSIDPVPVFSAPSAAVSLWSFNRDNPITFDFYWEYYLTFMLSLDTKPVGRAFKRATKEADQAAMKFVRCHPLEFEASELDVDAFRDDFQSMRETSALLEGIHHRFFLVCATEGTPELYDIFRSGLRYLVWVVDGDWRPPEGKYEDEDGYQGKIKVRLVPPNDTSH